MATRGGARKGRDDGRFEAAGLVRVTFELEPADWHETATERLWAEPSGEGLFVLRNSPFFANGVSFLDTVRAARVGDAWMFRKLHASAGHSTYRVFRLDPSVAEAWDRSLAAVLRLGCTYEGADDRLAAVDVPPAADLDAVLAALQRGEEEGRWEFEEAHLGRARA